MTFVAIDFETANYSDASICAAGLAVFTNGKLTESKYWLVRPPKGRAWFREDFTENCHGLTWFDVQDAPEFPVVAAELLPRLATADIVIAHNAEFDMRKMSGILDHFGLAWPSFDYLCTLRLARRAWPQLPGHALNVVAEHIGHQFQHHHAQADAEAAGYVLLAMMEKMGVDTPRNLAAVVGVTPTAFR